MDDNLAQVNNCTEIRHSTLAKVAFAILVSMMIPFIIMLIFWIRILPIPIEQIMFLNKLLFCWIISAPIFSLKLALMDLKRSDRLKTLPRITVISSSVIIGIGVLIVVISVISDIRKIN
jgi:hypothetical protein